MIKKQAEHTLGTLVHAHQQLHPYGDAGVPAQRQQADVASYDGGAQQVLYHGGAVRVPIEDPVVSCLVFVIDPVESFHSAILDAVFSNPLISIAAALGEDARHHTHLHQVNLDPLMWVVKLGEPCTPKALVVEASIAGHPGGVPSRVLVLIGAADLL